MATDKSMMYRFDFGTSVSVKNGAPVRYKRIHQGSVCGMREIDNEEAAKLLREAIGTRVYLIENAVGDSLEIPEEYLEYLEDL
jgi:hypothetical protein